MYVYTKEHTIYLFENCCKDQDIEICGIQLNYEYDKLCILAVYRSPSGKFKFFLTNLDLVLQKFFLSQTCFYLR
jgi:hypothetical protein